ncbi:MAG TPA: hypothetical protein VNK41_06665 [Vicinamibacterales bacterium]|nr:hypothetical protein [Vicinamibacterales bacterium]
MWEQANVILRRSADRIAENVADFLPGLLVLVLILLVALIVAVAVRVLLVRVLRGMEFDRRAEQLGLRVLVDWSPTEGASMLVARAAMWLILFVGLLAGLSALDATMPTQFALRVFRYLPNLFAAAVILLVGNVISRFVARSVLIGAVNLQMRSARFLSAGVRWLVLILAWAMALEHLGIGRQILTLAFAILFGGVVFALSLAIGLGSKDMVSRSLERLLGDAEKRPDRMTHV